MSSSGLTFNKPVSRLCLPVTSGQNICQGCFCTHLCCCSFLLSKDQESTTSPLQPGFCYWSGKRGILWALTYLGKCGFALRPSVCLFVCLDSSASSIQSLHLPQGAPRKSCLSLLSIPQVKTELLMRTSQDLSDLNSVICVCPLPSTETTQMAAWPLTSLYHFCHKLSYFWTLFSLSIYSMTSF